MSVVTLNELKNRFVTRDRPTQKDYADLIDTLVASIQGLPPSGAAGGALAGTYPDPSLASSSSNDAVRPVGTNNVKDAAITVAKITSVGAPAGYVATAANGNTVTWQPQGTSTNTVYIDTGTGLPAVGSTKGTLQTWISDEITLPAASGTLFYPDTYLPIPVAIMGMDMPQQFRVVAVFQQTFADFQIGDEVPIEYFRLLADPRIPAFRVDLKNGDLSDGEGLCTHIYAYVEYGDVAGSTGIAVFDKTSGSATIGSTLIPFITNNAYVIARIKLKFYATRFTNGTGFGSIAESAPADAAIPGTRGSAATFTNDFQAPLSLPPNVFLTCVDAELAYTVGDQVPVGQFVETGTDVDVMNPAFSVVSDNNTVKVIRTATTAASHIKVPNKTSGALALINEAKWRINVRAYKTINSPSFIIPATVWEMATPYCPVSYNNNLLCPYSDLAVGAVAWNNINLVTGAVTRPAGITAISPAPDKVMPSLFRFYGSTTYDYINFISGGVVRRIQLPDLVSDSEILFSGAGGDFSQCRVVDCHAGVGTHVHPDLLITQECTTSDSSTSSFMSHRAWKVVWGGSAYTYTEVTTPLNWSTVLTAATGFNEMLGWNTGNNSNNQIRFFAYNNHPNYRRMYLMTQQSGLLHVFQLKGTYDSSKSLYDWWASSPDASQLEYVKTIAIPGSGMYYSTGWLSRYCLEYDLSSGAERALTFNRIGFPGLTGTVTRMIWPG